MRKNLIVIIFNHRWLCKGCRALSEWFKHFEELGLLGKWRCCTWTDSNGGCRVLQYCGQVYTFFFNYWSSSLFYGAIHLSWNLTLQVLLKLCSFHNFCSFLVFGWLYACAYILCLALASLIFNEIPVPGPKTLKSCGKKSYTQKKKLSVQVVQD